MDSSFGVSVIIPLYNKARTVNRAIQSVVKQDIQAPLEIIIVNDCSTDLDPETVNAIKAQNISWIDLERNLGPSAARNAGIAKARYAWLSFLDADDYWHDDFLPCAMAEIDKKPTIDLISSGYILKNPHLTLRCFDTCSNDQLICYQGLEYFEIAKIGITPVISSALVVRKDIVKKAGLFPEHVREAEDLWLWSRLALLDVQFAFINRCLVTYDMTHSTENQRLVENIQPLPHLKMLEDWHQDSNTPVPAAVNAYVSEFKLMFFFRLTIYQPRNAKQYLSDQRQSFIPPRIDWRAKLMMNMPMWTFRWFDHARNLPDFYDRRIRNNQVKLIPVSRDD